MAQLGQFALLFDSHFKLVEKVQKLSDKSIELFLLVNNTFLALDARGELSASLLDNLADLDLQPLEPRLEMPVIIIVLG